MLLRIVLMKDPQRSLSNFGSTCQRSLGSRLIHTLKNGGNTGMALAKNLHLGRQPEGIIQQKNLRFLAFQTSSRLLHLYLIVDFLIYQTFGTVSVTIP